MSTASRFRKALEQIDRAGIHLPGCIERVEDDADDLRAQTYDPIGRSNVSSVLVCKEHGVDLTECDRAERACVVSIPVAVHNDPTGESAVNAAMGQNPHLAALAELDRKVHALENLARWLDDFVHDHAPRTPRQANPVESKKAEQANAKPAGCARCATHGKWNAPHTAKPTDVGGVLPVPELVCQGHYDRIRATGHPTSTEDDQRYAKTGKWPKIRQTERLAAGIQTGVLS